ncbi:MAG: hypothetical protein M3R57_10535, partial [Chloroflexota bacterium]|nr:hypothetical protein [Chloroflexota bacterium]
RWLEGGDPWLLPESGAVYAAPPPTLLAMVPFAVIPEALARPLLLALGVAASVWMIRRLKLPYWWLAFPPLVDGLWIANPHVFVAPLLVAGLAPLAVIVKLYAGAVPAIRLEWKALAATAVLLLVTAPFLPWGLFIERWPDVSRALSDQSAGGGLSVWVTPLLVPIAVVAALVLGRERRAWWAVPVFWPYTQWYYSALALPVLTPLAAVALSVPVPGATTVALVIAVAEVSWIARRKRRSSEQPPGPDPLPIRPAS